MCFGFEILSCINPFSTTSGSSHKIEGVMIYILIFNVLRVWDFDKYMFMHWYFSRYIWNCSQCFGTSERWDDLRFDIHLIYIIFMHWSFRHYIWRCSRFILVLPKRDEMIYVSILNVLRVWYIFMHWSFSRYIWKCSRFFGTSEWWDDLHFDIHLIYIHALIL